MVDDTPENLVALEATLSTLEEDLVLAHSGTEALRYLLEHDFAAVLLDVRMPVMDGFETAQYIRNRQRSRHIPILLLSKYKSDGQLLRGQQRWTRALTQSRFRTYVDQSVCTPRH